MGTLITRKNGIQKNYLLNLDINPEVTEKVVNDILDNQEIEDWEIVEHFIL